MAEASGFKNSRGEFELFRTDTSGLIRRSGGSKCVHACIIGFLASAVGTRCSGGVRMLILELSGAIRHALCAAAAAARSLAR